MVSALTGTDNSFDAILTVKDFLIIKLALVKSTLETLFFGNFVYNVLSVEGDKLVVKTLRSVTSSVVEGNFPSATPETVETPEITTLVEPTLTTFAYTGSDNEVSLYEIIFPSFKNFSRDNILGLVIVLMPEDTGEISAIPMVDLVDWITSAENVDAEPTKPYTDLISEVPYAVTAIETYPDSIPSKINDSFLKKFPFVSYKVIKLLLETSSLINPLAPLFFPWTKVGTDSVIGSFKVISVIVCISYREISHSFIFWFVRL